ncbi:hypothetical protein FHT82_002441 [Rhizobium sp. BK275]|uniref:hypothetical protein n=1 Tax=Rhizobium sp. BK275 TaxID=2587077 RepID=UPI001620B662|nr:hypothetical protein [Rhizobium sp. BK275]MBB3389701.1 hypothetical protein [Rhizobium sp. BK275]
MGEQSRKFLAMPSVGKTGMIVPEDINRNEPLNSLTDARLIILRNDLDIWRKRRSSASPGIVDQSIERLLCIYRAFFENGFRWSGGLPRLGETQAVRHEMAAGAVMLLLHFCECGLARAAHFAGIEFDDHPTHRMNAAEHTATITFANDLVQAFKEQLRFEGAIGAPDLERSTLH